MPRAALSQDQVDEFRDALCATATRLFAEHGYEGVTMRALARELDCSPMTPYRYFENKAAIFETVRAAAANRFADAIEAAARRHADPTERLRALCRAYVGYALEEPDGYRMIFELDADTRPADAERGEARGWMAMRRAVGEAIDAGVLRGDPEVVATLYWSGVHGLVALRLAGLLDAAPPFDALVEAFIERELAG